jgi:hypothetical protein
MQVADLMFHTRLFTSLINQTIKEEREVTNMKKLIAIFTAVSTILLAAAAWATPFADITYDYTKSGDTYTFDLTVKNTFTSNLDFFQINLGKDTNTSHYTNIAWSDGKGWATTAVPDDSAFSGLPGAVTADDSFMGSGGGGIASTLSGFKFQFDYTGLIDPTAQSFSYLASFGTIADPTNGYLTALDETGNISYYHPSNNNNPVPEPGTIVLLGAGFASMGIYIRRRKSLV